MKRVIANVAEKTIKVVAVAVNPGPGETLVGTIDHDEAGKDDSIGWQKGHVVYHHIEQLMNKAKLFDHHLYTITVA